MRARARLMLLAVAAALALPVAGCDQFDSLQAMFDTKKKLPGERKPVFPEGVPGLQQGVPAEYLPGARAPEGEAAVPPTETAATPEAQ
ncbi:hypothetical protein PQJ75_27740, partial [Rhodoplanes sp. TEM]|nr:hypothetical protein [Rhodoplanes sp. TEM]